jgi:hypothetical protein
MRLRLIRLPIGILRFFGNDVPSWLWKEPAEIPTGRYGARFGEGIEAILRNRRLIFRRNKHAVLSSYPSMTPYSFWTGCSLSV